MTYVQGNSEPFRFTDEQTGGIGDRRHPRADGSGHFEPVAGDGSASAEGDFANVYRAELENATVLRARVVMPLSGSAAAQENAALAAAQFQNVRLEAGERLSFNQTVGLRTDESGYVQAEEPAYGQDISGIGGGVCRCPRRCIVWRCSADWRLRSAARRSIPFPIARRGRGDGLRSGAGSGLCSTIRRRPLFLTARVYGTDDGQTMELQLIGQPTDDRFALESEIETIDAPG